MRRVVAVIAPPAGCAGVVCDDLRGALAADWRTAYDSDRLEVREEETAYKVGVVKESDQTAPP